jgi:hypothetical protein
MRSTNSAMKAATNASESVGRWIPVPPNSGLSAWVPNHTARKPKRATAYHCTPTRQIRSVRSNVRIPLRPPITPTTRRAAIPGVNPKELQRGDMPHLHGNLDRPGEGEGQDEECEERVLANRAQRVHKSAAAQSQSVHQGSAGHISHLHVSWVQHPLIYSLGARVRPRVRSGASTPKHRVHHYQLLAASAWIRWLEGSRTARGPGLSLNLSATAMGIDTPAQRALMQSLGCDHGQGHVFAQALQAGDVDALLEADNAQPLRSEVGA